MTSFIIDEEDIMILYNAALKEKARLEQSINEKRAILETLPDGILQIFKDRKNNQRWYILYKHTDENGRAVKERQYLRKTQRDIAEQLARKGLLEQEIREEQQELKAVDMYLRNRSNTHAVDAYLAKSDEIKELLRPSFETNLGVEEREWLQQEYNSSDKSPERLTIRCRNGLLVRSKSERLIADKLIEHGLAFKYECPLDLICGRVYPDFTIMHPVSKELYYWEHCGMMDNDRYIYSCTQKIANYARSGIMPMHRLILTFEDRNNVLDELTVYSLIEQFFM